MPVARETFRRAIAPGLLFGAGLLFASPALAAGELELIPNPRLLIANLLLLLLLIYPVNRFLLKPLVALLQEREVRTEGALERAAELTSRASQTAEELGRRLAEAQAGAQTRRASLIAEGELEERRLVGVARSDAVQEVEAIRASVAEELVAARQSLRDDARILAREAAYRILGREL